MSRKGKKIAERRKEKKRKEKKRKDTNTQSSNKHQMTDHGGGEDHGQWVGLVLAGDVWGRAVARLEDPRLVGVPHGGAREHAQAPYQHRRLFN
jgi:hypothetical protein